jgi:hypothetical protein
MGFLPSPDIDLSTMSNVELEALKRLLEQELAMSKARQAHIEMLLNSVNKRLGQP